MRRLNWITIGFYCLFTSLEGAIDESVIICGIARNIEPTFLNCVRSIEELGAQFADYRVIIYENNSKDRTKAKLRHWAVKNPRVMIISENISTSVIAKHSPMKTKYRTEPYARARNIVLDTIRREEFDPYPYVIVGDLDFQEPWDVENIVDTIAHPEYEWDAVFANGSYDMFAFRHRDFPIGHELAGKVFWDHIQEVSYAIDQANLFDPDGPWFPVYSAFGGVGIYKREAMLASRYHSVVTKDLECQVEKWLLEADMNVPLYLEYLDACNEALLINLEEDYLHDRKAYPEQKLGIRLWNGRGNGTLIWLSAHTIHTLPWTCEHIPFHATMAAKGFDRLFVNPRIRSGR